MLEPVPLRDEETGRAAGDDAGCNGWKSNMSHMPAYEQMQVKRAAERVAELYSAWGKPEQEARWRATVAQL